MTALLKKFMLVMMVLSLGLSAQAKSTESSLSASEQDAFALCSLLSYLNYNAMNKYQEGVTKAKNKAFLMDMFADGDDKENQAMYEGMIERSLAEVYTLPKGKDKQEKEEYSMALAVGVLQGCADEVGLDLQKINNNN